MVVAVQKQREVVRLLITRSLLDQTLMKEGLRSSRSIGRSSSSSSGSSGSSTRSICLCNILGLILVLLELDEQNM